MYELPKVLSMPDVEKSRMSMTMMREGAEPRYVRLTCHLQDAPSQSLVVSAFSA